MQNSEDLLSNLSEDDPQQLRQVVQMLMAKTRLLLENLDATCDHLQQAQTERDFWKDSYFNLRTSCQQYVQCNGLTPFNYIIELQEQLKKEKVYKSCLEEKFKVMCPGSHSLSPSPGHTPSRSPCHSPSPKKPVMQDSSKRGSTADGPHSSTRPHSFTLEMSTQSPSRVNYQNKDKIGPKSREFFRFREQKS